MQGGPTGGQQLLKEPNVLMESSTMLLNLHFDFKAYHHQQPGLQNWKPHGSKSEYTHECTHDMPYMHSHVFSGSW